MPHSTRPSAALTQQERSILDGFEQPTIQTNITPDIVKYTPNFNSQGESTNTTKTAESIQNPEQILDIIQKALANQQIFDPLTGAKHNIPGQTAKTEHALSPEHMDLLIEHVKKQIKEVKAKSEKLKTAIRIRQEADPTVVTFDPKKNSLLKRGMQRVFGQSNNQITYEQYEAALEARKELARKNTDKELSGLRAVVGYDRKA